MQKDIAKSIVLVVLEEIAKEIGSGKIYGILADEATDVNVNESMTVVICYVSCLTGQICGLVLWLSTTLVLNPCSKQLLF